MRKIALCLTVLLTVASLAGYSQREIGCSTNERAFVLKSLDTSNGRGLADNYYLWEPGEVLKIKFLSGSPEIRQKVLNIAKEWEQYANIRFELVTGNAPSHIRVMLDNKGGHNSSVGTNALNVKQADKTMNFDTSKFYTADNFHGTVLHEFGHAIGLLHEHYSPVAGIKWNKPVVYEELKRTQGWNEDDINHNLFETYAVSYTNGTAYDRKSIMHYPVYARWTTDGYSVDWNNYLSDADKAFIAMLYPKTGVRTYEVPRMTITDFTTMNIIKDEARKGISLYPSFNISTAGVSGTVYLAAFFFDADGKPLTDTDDQYNIFKVVSTFKSLTLEPNLKLSANKIDAKDFELFIPYAQIPAASGTTLKVIFKPFVFHNKEVKWLYTSELMSFSLTK